MAAAAEYLLTIVQVESAQAVENVEAIAATPGADVLFVGPTDLSHSLGILGQFDHPIYIEAVDTVAAAAKRHGKHLGILLPKPEFFDFYHSRGFRFIGCGNDGILLNNAARAMVKKLHELRDAAKG